MDPSCELKKTVKFSLRLPNPLNLTPYVVGDCLELGNWLPVLAVPLSLECKLACSGDETWTGFVEVNADEINYRYFIGQTISCESGSFNTIHTWESNPEPRRLMLSNDAIVNEAEANFGFYGDKTMLNKGFLTGQTEVRLRFKNNSIFVCNSSYKTFDYLLKCDPINLKCCDDEANENMVVSDVRQQFDTMNKIFVSVLDGERDLPSSQSEKGTLYNTNDFLTFSVQTCSVQNLAFKISVSVVNCGAEIEIGSAFLCLVGSERKSDTITAAILTRDQEFAGKMIVDVLIVESLHDPHMELKSSSQNVAARNTMLVGHRGMGSSFSNGKPNSPVRENTIHSLSQAAVHGADMVEFDVMLSRDDVPLVYHDFVTCLDASGHEDIKKNRFYEIAIQDLNYKDLLSSSFCSLVECRQPGKKVAHAENGEHIAFPRLKDCLVEIDQRVGLNIEIKYCMQLKSGIFEDGLRHHMERNKYIETILNECLTFGGERRIVFSLI